MTSPSIIQTRPATGKSFWPDSTLGDGHQPAAGSRDEFQRLRAAYDTHGKAKVAHNDGLEHIAPALGAVHVAGTQRAALQIVPKRVPRSRGS
jgi:hypothetical protein